MITVKHFNELIEDFLKKNYHPKVYNKHFTYYQEILEKMLEKYSENNNLYNEHKSLQVANHDSLRPFHVKLKKGEFHFRYDDYKFVYTRTIGTKFLNGKHTYKCKDIPVLNIIIKDLITMGILVKVKGKQPINIDEKQPENTVFTPAYYTINFNSKTSSLFSDSLFEFEYVGDFKPNSKSIFQFELDDLMALGREKNVKPMKFLQNFFLLTKMNRESFRIIKVEDVGRVHHSLSRVSEEFRAIVKTQFGEEMMSFDISSSHPFWLAILTENKILYNDIKSGRFKKIFDKKRVLTWFNTPNYNSKHYNKEKNLFNTRYDIDTTNYRVEDSLYPTLAKLESAYIQSISKAMIVDDFTIHDQVYFPVDSEDEFWELVKSENEKLIFEPIWVSQ
jgi:hypothetical protein